MEHWEYRTVTASVADGADSVDEQQLNETFNALGREGWELVTAAPIPADSSANRAIAYTFKRPIRK